MIRPHPTNLVITTASKLLEATDVLLCKLFPDVTDFTDYQYIAASRYYFSEADCFHDAKAEKLLSFVIKAYDNVSSYDETNWKTLCATLSTDSYKTHFAGQKCTDILYITDKAATLDSNREWDFSDTDILGTVVFGYLHVSEDQYKMSYWLTVDEGVHWYDLQDSTATPVLPYQKLV